VSEVFIIVTNAPPELVATLVSCRADRLFYAQRYLLLPAMQPCRRSDWLLISDPCESGRRVD
jgi:hypothetical protein